VETQGHKECNHKKIETMHTKSRITTLLLLLIWGFTNGQTTNNTPLPLDPAVRAGKLANGFTYYIRKNTEPKDRATLYLVNKVGSVLENDNQQGLAHFMEHMSFNGTTHFPKNELVNYLQKAGVRFGSDLNAFTSFDETVYQLPIPTDDAEVFNNGMQIMRDWAQEATLDPVEIDKERGVILEEKRLGKGAEQRMQEKYLPVIFNNSRYAQRIPIGTEEVLKNFKPETLRQFYTDWYRPGLQALIVVGDINVDAVEKMIKTKFSDLKVPKFLLKRIQYTIPLSGQNQFIAVTDNEFPYTVLQVFIKQPELVIKTSADYRKSLQRSIFNQMLADRYSELSKQADPAYIQGGASMGAFLAGLDVYNTFIVAKPGELENGFKAVWRETERAKQFGFTQSELDRAKQSILINMESALKEKDKTASENFVNEYMQYFLKGEAAPGIEAEYKLAQQQIPGITLAEINDLTKQYISVVNRDVVIMAPEKEKANLPDKVAVVNWIKSIQDEKLTAYVDQVSDKPLVAKIPAAGKVVSEKKLNELSVTELTLRNGAKIVLKPTDFKTDEIQFNAFSPGGTSLYSDIDYQSAANAANIVGNSGLGDFTANELPKLLNGKIVEVSPYISERAEGIRGYSAPKDLETAMKLIYLYFTEPRKDTAIFSGFISRSISGLANRADDPKSVFSDTVSAVLGNYSIRRTGPSITKIKQINIEKVYAVYKERFADASDFTFTFIGNFDVEQIKPLLEQWLGSLPSINRVEQAKNLGIHIPAGKIQKTVYKGSEQKATVRLVFSGEYTYNEDNNIQLEALGEVLQIKLLDRLRELEGGVYSPSARTNYTKYPTNRYSITVAFGCAPENVDKLIAATMDEINKIKTNGAEAGDIQKVIAEDTRTTETQLKENGFWLNYLSRSFENKDDPNEILEYISSLKNVTPQSVKAATAIYLSGDNLVKLVLLPEQKN
jgi:zinc protease